MMKPTNSQLVESKKTIEYRSRWRAILRTPDGSVSLEIPPIVTRDEDHVANEDIEDTENQG